MKYSYFMLLTPPTLYFCNLIAQFCADIAESPLLLAIKKGLLPELRALWDIILASSPYVSTTHLYTYHHFLHFANKLSFSNQSPLYSIRLLTKKLHIFSIGHNTSLVRTVFIPWARTKTNIFYPLSPHLVHVFIEWPLRLKWYVDNQDWYLLHLIPNVSFYEETWMKVNDVQLFFYYSRCEQDPWCQLSTLSHRLNRKSAVLWNFRENSKYAPIKWCGFFLLFLQVGTKTLVSINYFILYNCTR